MTRLDVACHVPATAATKLYTLSLHDALPISPAIQRLDRPDLRRCAERTMSGRNQVAQGTVIVARAGEIGRASCREKCRSRWSRDHEKKKIREITREAANVEARAKLDTVRVSA